MTILGWIILIVLTSATIACFVGLWICARSIPIMIIAIILYVLYMRFLIKLKEL